MLNNDLVKLCEVLDKLCVDGYNTIDKSDIFDGLNNDFGLLWDIETLNGQIKGLAENKFITIKYQDEAYICLIFTEAGRELVRRIKIARQNEDNSQKSKRQLKKEQQDNKGNFLEAVEQTQPTGEQILSGLMPVPVSNQVQPQSKIKNFFVGLLGGILGGGISGTIITLLVLFLW